MTKKPREFVTIKLPNGGTFKMFKDEWELLQKWNKEYEYK